MRGHAGLSWGTVPCSRGCGGGSVVIRGGVAPDSRGWGGCLNILRPSRGLWQALEGLRLPEAAVAPRILGLECRGLASPGVDFRNWLAVHINAGKSLLCADAQAQCWEAAGLPLQESAVAGAGGCTFPPSSHNPWSFKVTLGPDPGANTRMSPGGIRPRGRRGRGFLPLGRPAADLAAPRKAHGSPLPTWF